MTSAPRRSVSPVVSVSAFTLCLVLAASPVARANSTGITGRSGNPAHNGGLTCNACHAGGAVPTVTINGPTSVQPGTTSTYTLRITGGAGVAGGLNVSTTAGTLAVADPGTRLSLGEITHTTPRNFTGGLVEFTFNWTAPAAPGSARLYGAGNSTNRNFLQTGDRANNTTLDITVAAPAANPGEASGRTLPPLLVTGYDAATGDMSLTYGAACGATNHDIYYGPLAAVGTYGWSGNTCNIGASGSFNTFDPGSGSFFFVVVANNGAATKGSYGVRSDGTTRIERPSYTANTCGRTQNLTNRCDPTP